MRRVRVHLAGGRTFLIDTAVSPIGEGNGFYAWPADPASPFGELFFYRRAVTACETPTQLGAMLVEEGAVDPAAVERALAVHAAPIGQLLIEQEKATPEIVDAAVQVQERTRHRPLSDGDCAIYQEIPPPFRGPLVARLKIMADLDISARRKPQDGKIRFRLGDQKIELRVATIPTVNHEDVVLRILAASKPLPLDAMGFSERNPRELRAVTKRPCGLVLCVGPTGSGKTTTLHPVLGSINTEDMKIWTAESPVEITRPGLRQVQVQPKIGFDFAAAMRAFLRADPDVIMVGEMRDRETAGTAVEASLTGHLVLSTLHTNSAPEAITCLLGRVGRAVTDGEREDLAAAGATIDPDARLGRGAAARLVDTVATRGGSACTSCWSPTTR